MSYTLIVSPTIEESITLLEEMKGIEKDQIVKDTERYYITDNTKVMAIFDNQAICGLKHNGKRPDKAIVHGDVSEDWVNRRLIPSLDKVEGKVIYAC